MAQQCTFVDPSSLSLPSSSLKRSASPALSVDDTPLPTGEPPRKRPRSAVTPEERKEARAHRNRIAAQNSRDRRKAQFTYLERRVAELEEENRCLRAGIHVSPSPSISEPNPAMIDHEQDQQRKRERENQELRERIRTLERGYELVVRALAAQGNPSVSSSIPTPPATSPALIEIPVPQSQSSSQPISHTDPSITPPPPSNLTFSSSAPLPLSPTSSNSTLVDSPLLLASGDSFDFVQSPALLATETSHSLPDESTGGEHCLSFSSVPAAGGRCKDSNETGEHNKVLGNDSTQPEDEAASDAAITRLFAEILASPPLGSGTLPDLSSSSEGASRKEVLTKTEIIPSNNGLGLGIAMSGADAADWVERVHAEMEMEKLLEMLPSAQDVSLDAILRPSVNLDVDMDFTWDGVSVF